MQNRLWGAQARVSFLFIAAAILLFAFLGSREIWTQEHRWADIVYTMFASHDFFHPKLDGADYYDKPLLSYWMIAFVSLITGKLSTIALRLPSALAGLLAIFSIYKLGKKLKNQQFGLLAGWMLLTTFYFVFWARTSSADMLNVAGTLFGVMWYFEKKDCPNFFNYSILFIIMAVTALCKGLVGPAVITLAILPDLLVNQNWKKHLNITLFVSLIPAAIIYVLPFWASTHFGAQSYGENGLYLVYRENILRYFQPFDHKGPLYTYFLYLPIYLLPWAIFFIPALLSQFTRWKNLSWESKWISWATLIIFLFFTLSGSRRSYYVLPLVPFGILMAADWILAKDVAKRQVLAGLVTVIFYGVLFLNFDVAQPFYYSQNVLTDFSMQLQTKIGDLQNKKIILLDVESKVPFYLGLSPDIKNLSLPGDRGTQTTANLIQAWPILKNKSNDAIFITRKMYVPLLQSTFKDYAEVVVAPSTVRKLLQITDDNDPVAFIPKSIMISKT